MDTLKLMTPWVFTLHCTLITRIVSPDKDMRQIPGKLYNLDEMTEIDPEEGRRWHLVQTLAGDQTDGYGGVPGIGVKRAISLFEKTGYNWKTVVTRFQRQGTR